MVEDKGAGRLIPGLEPGMAFGGGYRLVRRLGAGGMGEVWLAREDALDRDVALKILRQEDDAEEEKAARDVRRFHREASILAACGHPAILPVFQSGSDAATGLLFYTTLPCLLTGKEVRHLCADIFDCPFPKDLHRWDEEPRALSLADLLRGGKTLPEKVVAGIGRSIVSAIAYAHALPEPVFHRDVKPSNILFSKDGGAILSDFGIAKRVHAPGVVSPTLSTTSSERRHIFIGTYAYAAPEQQNGEGSTPAVDYYSIAAVLYEALTGQRPRSLSKPSEFDPKHISGIWDTLLPAMLAADPEQRLTDPAAIDHALARVESGRRWRMEWPAKAVRPSRKGAIGMALAVAVLAAFAGVRTWRHGRAGRTDAVGDSRPPVVATTPPSSRPVQADVAGASPPDPPAERTTPPSPTAEEGRFHAFLLADRATSFGRHLPDAFKARRSGIARAVALPGGLSMSFVWCRNKELPARDIYDFQNYDDTQKIPNIEIHQVILVTNFCWMARTEVTRAQWAAVMGEATPADGGDLPVLCTYFDAERFVKRLNALGIVTNGVFALPTESQWEHATRGVSLKYFNGKKPEDLGWFAENSDGRLHPVAQKGMAGYGLYDAHGNAPEWCRDRFAPQEEGPLVDPFVAPESPDDARVVRGGSFKETVSGHLSEFRRGLVPTDLAGFRLALFDRP